MKPGGNPQRRARHLQQLKGGHNAWPAPDGLGGPSSRKQAPGTPPPRPTHRVHDEHQEPTTHNHANYDPGTPCTTGPLGGRR